MIDFLFLGTSSGIPTSFRNVSGLAIRLESCKDWLLVDAGEGTQHTIAKAKLSLLHLKLIAITHAHGDHCYGLPGILASASMAKRKSQLTIVCSTAVWHWLQQTIQLTQLYLSFPIEWIDVAENNDPYDILNTEENNQGFNLSICSQALVHRVESYGFVFQYLSNKRKLIHLQALQDVGLPAYFWSQLQKGQDVTWQERTFKSNDFTQPQVLRLKWIVGGDNAQPEVLQAQCQDAQLLIHEATYTQAVLDKIGPAPMHCSAKEVALMAQASQLPYLILTHLSARFHHAKGEDEIRQEAQRFYKGDCYIARDGSIFHLSENGELHYQNNFLKP